MQRKAVLYRMVLPDHVCPYGVHALQLLEQHGFDVDDQVLSTRIEVDAFKQEHRVDTTPQIFVDDKRIGGSEQLEDFLAAESAQA